ncbi:hypothetical protein DSO57_1011271 [Entomophthora muscae]|uniref:Uncharacterized protein n=1 Tax=Entomophthora muscae TaxID=34485 RepID=A0ACC2TT87_9FUNG|nr:hypothetical protein DSO57_1011271 [Entomophthora muscae]
MDVPFSWVVPPRPSHIQKNNHGHTSSKVIKELGFGLVVMAHPQIYLIQIKMPANPENQANPKAFKNKATPTKAKKAKAISGHK